MQDLTVSIIQTNILWQQPQSNLEQLEAKITKLKDKTDLVVLPEMFNTGFTMDTASCHETMAGPSVNWLIDQSKKLNTWIAGSLIIEENNKFYNRLIICSPKGIEATYDKRHLFRMANEHIPFTAGTGPTIVTLKGWKINLQVCYDLRFPVFARNTWTDNQAGYDLLLYVANWPNARISAWETLLKARAIENLSCCVGVNRIGTDGENIDYNGRSMCLNHLGEPLNTINSEEKVETVTFSGEALTNYRQRFPAHADADRFQIL